VIGGRYELVRELARGGMGAVWLGTDVVLGRDVAIKRVGVMPGGSSPDLLRAEREARIAASLSHPHIVGIYDLVHDQDQQWLVMEYVPGSTLAEMVRTRGPLPGPEVAAVLAQAAAALKAAHAAGIVHRDVKPSNILVRPDGDAKLSDFGIARAEADASLTQTGLVTGSPAYLAPEVASGQLAGPPADVWSLGATLFHALAGHPPYDVGENVLGALYRIVHEDPPRLADAGPLAPLLEATMVVDPSGRWSMGEVERFLQRQAGAPSAPAGDPGVGEPRVTGPTHVLAVPPPVPAAGARRAKPRTDRRGLVLPVAVVVVLVALVAALALLFLGGDDTDQTAVDPGATSAPPSEPSGGPSSDPSTGSPSATADPVPDAAAMQQFVEDYIATAAASPERGFALLTPQFQRESGGLSGYTNRFWGNVQDAQIQGTVTADPGTLEVGYTYRYRLADDSTRTERVTLRLSFDPTTRRYLVAGAGGT